MSQSAIRLPADPSHLPEVHLPNSHKAQIPRRKIAHYLLDMDHPKGGPKALFFMRCGFTAERPEELEIVLLDIARFGTVVETVPGDHGTKYVVEGQVETPRMEIVQLRTVWIVLSGDDAPRLVTSYPSPGRSG